MDISRKASFSIVWDQRGCSLTFGLLMQAFSLLALLAFADKVPA